jgi:AcrR family transcriptional regulator
MTDRAPARREQLSPNQLDRRRHIVEAARQVLATRGLAGGTVREVAAASGLTKSAIHYYFADMDDLVDRAMAEHVAAFVASLRAAGAAAAEPRAALWRTIDAYLDTFEDQPAVAHLWFEYWVDAARHERLEPVRRLHGAVVGVLADRLRAVGAPRPDRAAAAVFTHLLGAVVARSVDPGADPHHRRLHGELALLAGLDGP